MLYVQWFCSRLSLYPPVLSSGPQECVMFRGVFEGSACGPHGPYIPDVCFWSVVLFFSTVFMSAFLKEFKTSRYFPTKARVASDL